MGRFGTFLLGTLFGAVLLHTLMTFHVVHADSGVHLVRKTKVGLGDTYTDIRQFSIDDWRQHPNVARAMVVKRQPNVMPQRVARIRESVGTVFGNVLGQK